MWGQTVAFRTAGPFSLGRLVGVVADEYEHRYARDTTCIRSPRLDVWLTPELAAPKPAVCSCPPHPLRSLTSTRSARAPQPRPGAADAPLPGGCRDPATVNCRADALDSTNYPRRPVPGSYRRQAEPSFTDSKTNAAKKSGVS